MLFALPAAVGLVGGLGTRRAVVGAAAFASFCGAFLAFSGITLVFLLPAALFAAAVLGGAPVRPSGVVAAIVIAGLQVAAGAALMTLTETWCWESSMAAGCMGGTLTPTGVAVGSAPAAAALLAAVAASHPRRRASVGSHLGGQPRSGADLEQD